MKILTLLFFILASCQTLKPSCEDTRRAATIAGDKMANVLACKRPDRIAADLVAKIEEAKLCEEREQAALSEAICRPVAAYVGGLLASRLPASWECEGGAAKVATINTLYAACTQGVVL